MEDDFLDGIDEAFQKLMKLNGNGKRNGYSIGRAREDRLIAEIIDHLHKLSKEKQQEVLDFIRSLQNQKVG
jgi:hypothetical protein